MLPHTLTSPFSFRGPPWLLVVFLVLASHRGQAQAPSWQSAVAFSQASTSASQVQATAVDANGDVYLAGGFIGTASFGAIALTSAGNRDVFVAKWSPASNTFAWAVQAGGLESERAMALVVNGPSVYIAGAFESTATFGATTLVSAGQSDAFVAKLTDAGRSASFTWAVQAGGPDVDRATGVAVSGANVYLTGYYYGATARFGATTLANAGRSADAFVAKITDAGPTGGFTWVQPMGGTDFDLASAVAVRGTSVYVAGTTVSPTARFGPLTFPTAGQSDAFVTKLTDAGPTGSFAWVQPISGPGYEQADALAVGGTAVYVTGSTSSATPAFGPLALTSASPGSTVFVAKLADSGGTGRFAWAQLAGSATAALAQGMAVQGTDVYVCGHFYGTATFGGSTLTSATAGARTMLADLFVAKLTDAGPTGRFVWGQRAGGPNNAEATAIAADGANVYVGGTVYPPTSFGGLLIAQPAGNYVGVLAVLADNTALATAAAVPLWGVSLAPNPAHAPATVRVPPVAGAAQVGVTLRDGLGRVVYQDTWALPPAGLSHELPVAGIPGGVYLLQLQAGTAKAVRRLVVE